MKASGEPRLTAVERLNEGVVVKFSDGTCVFFTALLLHTFAQKAEPLNEEMIAW